jgi:hypothetical protein
MLAPSFVLGLCARGGSTSFDIYTAVLDHGVRSPAEFDQHLEEIRRRYPVDRYL